MIAGLKGKVVLVDFWTYACIGYIVTQPYLNAWYNKYEKDGLVILGLHTPKFSCEKEVENVQRAVDKAKIKYPFGLDNNFATWRTYNNKFWPAKYLIDKESNTRYFHADEGDYEGTEKAIRGLLNVNKETVANKIPEIKRATTQANS